MSRKSIKSLIDKREFTNLSINHNLQNVGSDTRAQKWWKGLESDNHEGYTLKNTKFSTGTQICFMECTIVGVSVHVCACAY